MTDQLLGGQFKGKIRVKTHNQLLSHHPFSFQKGREDPIVPHPTLLICNTSGIVTLIPRKGVLQDILLVALRLLNEAIKEPVVRKINFPRDQGQRKMPKIAP
jgi:hypothetical protein